VRYRVEITEPAERNIEEAHEWLYSRSESAALRWIDGLLEGIESLKHFPLRCPLAPESEDHAEEVRQVLYRHYRILYTIRNKCVYVLHIRHAARDRIRGLDLSQE